MGKVFTNRYEIKYIVPTRSLAYIRNSLMGLIVPDSFNIGENGYYNYSIYFIYWPILLLASRSFFLAVKHGFEIPDYRSEPCRVR